MTIECITRVTALMPIGFSPSTFSKMRTHTHTQICDLLPTSFLTMSSLNASNAAIYGSSINCNGGAYINGHTYPFKTRLMVAQMYEEAKLRVPDR
jgi:hypothetical protein